MSQYPRPPIVEAVLELQWGAAVQMNSIKKAIHKFKRDYPVVEAEAEYEVSLDAVGPPSFTKRETGFKLSSSDRANVVLAKVKSFGTVELAPYSGWVSFVNKARVNWQRFSKQVGVSSISRIGLRYVNRVDIPFVDGRMEALDYISVAPGLPDIGEPRLDFYTMQIVKPYKEPYSVMINTAIVLSPVPNAGSVLLDIDLFDLTERTARDEDSIWNSIEQMRMYKNEIFEACITDKARDLFSNVRREHFAR